MITLDDVAAAETARCAAMVAGDLATLDAVLHENLRYGHTSGNQDTKRSYLDKIEDGRLQYPELTSQITGHLVLANAVLCWLAVQGRVVLPGGPKPLNCSTLTVWVERDGRASMIGHQPTVLPIPAAHPPRPDRSGMDVTPA